MNVKVVKLEKLKDALNACPDDEFSLAIHGQVVHRERLDRFVRITCWALLEVGSGLAYAIGDDAFYEECLTLG